MVAGLVEFLDVTVVSIGGNFQLVTLGRRQLLFQ
jgi:hypothetical protein